MNGESSLIIGAGNLRAEFRPDAGMLCASLRHAADELLRRIDDLETARRKGSTAGIPLLYPWANRLGSLHYSAAGRDVQLGAASEILHFDEHGLPMHGVPWGELKWEVLDTSRDSVRAQLHWTRLEYLAVFPFPHTLEVAAEIAQDSLTLQTTVFANAGCSVPISFGFHPYFGISSLPRSQWRLQAPAMHHLSLNSLGIPTGAEDSSPPLDDLLGDRTYDDGFALLDERPSFALSAGRTTITVSFLEGFAFAQLFAPAGKDFIAIEPMTAPTNALASGKSLRILGPGAKFKASFRIAVQSAG